MLISIAVGAQRYKNSLIKNKESEIKINYDEMDVETYIKQIDEELKIE